jgi:hypothetical protein
VLPEGLGFLKLGWWMLHVIAVGLVFVWGYREGRDAEREERRAEERARRAADAPRGSEPPRPADGARPGPPPPAPKA